MSESSAIRRWGPEAGAKFLRLSAELLIHYRDIDLSADDLIAVMWINLHQWGEKAAFPHPVKLAFVLKVSEAVAVQRLYDLRDKGFITLEPTRNNSRNFHQDIRPTINKLRVFLAENPNHCEVIKRKSDSKRIDASSNRNSSLTDTSNSIDTSIPVRGGTSSVRDVINKHSENK